MNRIKTAIEFTKNIVTVGAFRESSPMVEDEICSKLDSSQDVVVIEFGMGHGNITRKILKQLSPNSTLYAFEINEDFCAHVADTIDDKRLNIIHDSAENVKKYFDNSVDFIIGSLPYSILPKKVGKKIIADSYDLLKSSSYYSQYLYIPYFGKRFKQVFDTHELVTIKNIPIEYVYHFWKD